MPGTVGKIYVVYARAATGLKEWPIAAFFNSESAAQDAAAYAARAVGEQRCFRAGGGSHVVARASVRDFDGWGRVPSLSKGW